MQVISGDLRVLGRDFVEDAGVELTGVHQDVGLMNQGQFFLLAAGGKLEGVAHQALDAVGSVE